MILTELLTRRDSRMARAVEIRRPLRAHARKTDPPTSHAAAASVKSAAISELQEWILEVLDEPKTDEQIWNALVERHSGLTPSGVRTRRAELVDAGKIIDSRLRGHSAHGRMTIIWQRSDQALFGAA